MKTTIFVLVKKPDKPTRGFSPSVRALKMMRRHCWTDRAYDKAARPLCDYFFSLSYYVEEDKSFFFGDAWPKSLGVPASVWDMSQWPEAVVDDDLPNGIVYDDGLVSPLDGENDADVCEKVRAVLDAHRVGYWAVVVGIHF